MKRKVTTVVGKAITIALGVISCENVENSAHLWYEPALVYKLRTVRFIIDYYYVKDCKQQ